MAVWDRDQGHRRLTALRWRLWHAPGPVVRRARRDIVRVLDAWPDAHAILAAHTRITALC